MKYRRLVLPCLAAGLLAAVPTHARVTRIVIDKTDRVGDGTYEVLRGRAFGALDPAAPMNAVITDLQFAPRNSRDQVEYVTSFSIAKPVDMSKASGVLWYELVNRAGPLRTFGSMASEGHVERHRHRAGRGQQLPGGGQDPGSGYRLTTQPATRRISGIARCPTPMRTVTATSRYVRIPDRSRGTARSFAASSSSLRPM